MRKKHNGEIDFLRFIFSVVVVFYHFNNNYTLGFFANGDIAVEFFFVLSGCLMASHVKNMEAGLRTWAEIADNTWIFIIKKAKSFFHYYLCVVLLNFFVRYILIRHISVVSACKSILQSIPTLTLTFMGLNRNSMSLYVGNTWYLSAMLIAMFILYPLLLKSFAFSTKILFPLVSMFSLGYLYNTYGTITSWEKWGVCYIGVLRAVAEIALGASLYNVFGILSDRFGQRDCRKRNLTKILFTVIKIGCYAAVLTFAFGGIKGGKFTLHALFICSVGIGLSFANIGYTIPDSSFTRYLGRISLPIFIFHGFIRLTCRDITGTNVSLIPAMLLVGMSIVLSIVLMYATDFCAGKIKKAVRSPKANDS